MNPIIKKVFDNLGYNLVKKPVSKLTQFYNPSESCQIPELATLYEIFFGERNDGLFVEVGAFDGISFSNSSCLANVGWEGILIEPIPEFAQACKDLYKGNPKITVIEAAIGSINKSVDITVAGALTTTDEKMISAYETIDWAKSSVKNTKTLTVTQRILNDVLHERNLKKSIDVLIVDVEGKEKEVFEGFDINHWKPRMIIAELAHTHGDLYKYSNDDSVLQQLIVDHGYSVIYKDSINTVFLSGQG